MPNSLHKHHNKCMADSKEITNEILGVKGLITTILLIKVCVHPH